MSDATTDPVADSGADSGADPAAAERLGLFAGFGVELEYMLVDAETLAVLPASDRLLTAAAGELTTEVAMGELAWSNELVLHVVELKTDGPATALEPLPGLFQRDVGRVAELLRPLGGRLMPTAMHPWMDPLVETRIWPHEWSAVYAAYDRIFGCQGHGWSNLQSMHLNLPFRDDAEFARLHAAIRLVLPILPALAASSPVVEGRIAGSLDARLEAYRRNSVRVPSIAGEVIPERAFSRAEYDALIFQPMYRDIAPHDPDEVLRDEFLNSRGAIARFGRGSIEIRVIDLQECPLADLAVAAATVAVLRALVAERWSSLGDQQRWEVAPLADLFRRTVVAAEGAEISDAAYLGLFGYHGRRATAGELWAYLVADLLADGTLPSEPWAAPLRVLLDEGPLARRILRALGPEPDRERLAAVYRRLCDGLERGELFHG